MYKEYRKEIYKMDKHGLILSVLEENEEITMCVHLLIGE